MAEPGSEQGDKGELADSQSPAEPGAAAAKPRIPLPSTNTSTNLLIADIVVRGASSLFRKKVEERVAEASSEEDQDPQEVIDGRTLLTTLGLYGASKLATRSVPGLVIVTGGLLAKTLYDRGRSRQKRLAQKGAED